MEEKAESSDDGRADHSQPRELLTLIISLRLDVGLSFVLIATRFLACSQLFLLSPGQALLALAQSTQGHTHLHTVLVTPWLPMSTLCNNCAKWWLNEGRGRLKSHYIAFFKVTMASTQTHTLTGKHCCLNAIDIYSHKHTRSLRSPSSKTKWYLTGRKAGHKARIPFKPALWTHMGPVPK